MAFRKVKLLKKARLKKNKIKQKKNSVFPYMGPKYGTKNAFSSLSFLAVASVISVYLMLSLHLMNQFVVRSN